MTRHIYSEEEKSWLRLHHDEMSRKDLTTEFNAHFGCNVKVSSIQDICAKRLGLRRTENGGTFAHRTRRSEPIGAERVFDGYWWVKVRDIKFHGHTTRKQFMENWIPKQRFVYQKHNKPVPDGWIVIFLNQNKEDFRPENLYCVSRRVHVRMSKNRWFFENPELTLAAAKWAELVCAVQDAERGCE